VTLERGTAYSIVIADPQMGVVPRFSVYSPGAKRLLTMSSANSHQEDRQHSLWGFVPPESGKYLIKLWEGGSSAPFTGNTYEIQVRPWPGAPFEYRYGDMGGVGLNAMGELLNPPAVVTKGNVSRFNYSHMLGASGGLLHSLAVNDSGEALAWGWNALGQLGTSDLIDHRMPQVVGKAGGSPLTGVVEVSAGMLHSLALKGDGTVWAWGSNVLNQLGDGTTTDRLQPVQVPGLDHIVQISAGAIHNLALKDDGTVWAWGWNGLGSVGNGSTATEAAPVRIGVPAGVTSVSAGLFHSLAATDGGAVWAWGWNAYGQLGDGTRTDRLSPVQTSAIGDAYQVAAGYLHSASIGNDGTVFAWGSNILKQAGGGSDRLVPAPMRCAPAAASCPRQPGSQNLSLATDIAAGSYHTAIRAADGSIWTWGWNGFHQLGDGTTIDRSDPVRILAAQGKDVGAGTFQTFFMITGSQSPIDPLCECG